MHYTLGIDLGTTTCAVAGRWGTDVSPWAIGEHTATMPAVALYCADGTVLVGEEADRHNAGEPALAGRPVASGWEEPAPTALDDHGWTPLALTQALLSGVIERAGPQAEPPDHLVLTYPLRGGETARARLAQAAVDVTGRAPTLVPEPVAAVAGLAHQQDLGEDATLAVVDVGASSTDVTLVRRTPTSLAVAGEPAGVPGLGGSYLDATVLALVESAVGDLTSGLAAAEGAGAYELWRLQAACRLAKESLSSASAAVVDAVVGHPHGQVEITRDVFERAVEPALAHVADLVAATIHDAGLPAEQLDGILLVGGTARVPLLATLLGDRTGLPVLGTDEPELTTALGAASFAEPVPQAAGPGDDGAMMAAGAMAAGPMAAGAMAAGAMAADPMAAGAMAAGPVDDRPTMAAVAAHEPGALAGGEASRSPYGDVWQPDPPDEHGAQDNQWADTRTSVFDAPPEPADAAIAGADTGWHEVPGEGETRLEQVRRISASDGDPFAGRGTSLRDRYDERRRDATASHDDEPAPGRRLLVVGGVSTVIVLLVAAFAFLFGSDGAGEPGTPAAQGGPSTTTETTIATTAPPPTAGAPVQTTEQPASTTSTTAAGTGRPPAQQPAPGEGGTTAPPATSPPSAGRGNGPPATRPSPTTAPPRGDGDDDGGLFDILGLG